MLKATILGSVFLLAAAPSAPQDSKVKAYAVIVNPKNKCNAKDDKAKAIIKKLFLKQMSQWPDGTTAKPYGRKDTAAEQSKFVKSVLGMGDAELVRHWIKMKNMKGTTPPKGVKSDRMLFKYVAKHAGAFGVVKVADAKKQKGVKILYRF